MSHDQLYKYFERVIPLGGRGLVRPSKISLDHEKNIGQTIVHAKIQLPIFNRVDVPPLPLPSQDS